MVSISIVIVNYNAVKYLKDSVKSIIDSDILLSDIEIIVIDNASSDSSVLQLEKFIALDKSDVSIKIIKNENNLGFSKSVNIGIKESNAKYVCILNPDTYIESNCLGGLRDYMDNNLDVDAVTPKILNSDGSLQKSCKRAAPGILNSMYKIIGLDRIFPNNKYFGNFHLLYLDEDEIEQIEVISGAFMFLRNSIIDKVGYFDERFYMYCEDTDYCIRINNVGGKIIYYPLFKAIHYRGESAKSRPFEVINFFHLSMIKYYNKYQDNYRFWKILKPIIVFSIIVKKYLSYLNLVIKKIIKRK